MPVITVVTLLPVSIGGLGLREAIMVALFTTVGLDKNGAFAMSLLNSFNGIILAAIAGLVYVFTLHHRRV
jgi:uncharacterized membrane protein YbhN (UPF0104 family)